MLLSHWDVDASVDENINRVQRDNVFGKASRSRVEAILAIFRQCYLTEESVTKALVTLVRKKLPTAALDRLLYFHSARADQLLHDTVTEFLAPMQARGLVDINVQDVQRSLAKWVNEGKTTGRKLRDSVTPFTHALNE
jgi:bacteriophage exclusion system BrxA-like protein